jgi:hypothetical protein
MSNIIAGILSLLFGIIGDIISRVIWFNCSVDKIWTLFFVMPPLSIVTAVLYFMGKIKPAPLSCGSIFDIFLVLIPVVVIILSKLLPMVVNQYDENDAETVLYKIIFMTLAVTFFALARIYKYYKACDKTGRESKGSSIMLNGFLRSLGANLSIMAFNWVTSLDVVQMIPVIGTPFTLWNLLGEFSPGIQHAIPLTLAHLVFNISENSVDFVDSICEAK